MVWLQYFTALFSSESAFAIHFAMNCSRNIVLQSNFSMWRSDSRKALGGIWLKPISTNRTPKTWEALDGFGTWNSAWQRYDEFIPRP